MSGGSDSRRSQRFPIKTSLRYRLIGEAEWRRGRTINISSSGVFFRSHLSVDVGTIMEINVVLLNSGTKEFGLEVACNGEVVRLESPPSAGYETALAVKIAAKITDYRVFPHVPGRSNADKPLEGPETKE